LGEREEMSMIDIEDTTKSFSKTKIKEALFQMETNKAVVLIAYQWSFIRNVGTSSKGTSSRCSKISMRGD
jgi:hypothetical protein